MTDFVDFLVTMLMSSGYANVNTYLHVNVTNEYEDSKKCVVVCSFVWKYCAASVKMSNVLGVIGN